MIEYAFCLLVGVAIGAALTWLRIQADLDRSEEQDAELDQLIDELADGP